LVTDASGALVKKLKVEIKEMIYIEKNNISTFKKYNTQFSRKYFLFYFFNQCPGAPVNISLSLFLLYFWYNSLFLLE
jgi:hypothetical protein